MNNKQRKFVAEYLKDQNATQAAIRAGYSKKTAGSQAHDLLKKPEIKSTVEEKLGTVAEKAEIDAAYWLASVREVFERCTHSGEFDSAGANAALRMIGQYLGLLSEKHVLDVGKTLEQIIIASMEQK